MTKLFTRTTVLYMGKCFLVLVPVLLLLASSCKKTGTEPAITEKKLFGSYQFIKITYKTGNTAEADVTVEYLNPCQADDVIILSASRTYEAVDAGTTCGNGDVISEWALIGSNTLKLGEDLYTIRKFDGKNLELSLTGTYRGATSTLVKYYVKE